MFFLYYVFIVLLTLTNVVLIANNTTEVNKPMRSFFSGTHGYILKNPLCDEPTKMYVFIH